MSVKKIIDDKIVPIDGHIDTDGSGSKPSVNQLNARILLDYIHSLVSHKIPHRPIRILDIGTGIGWFIKDNEYNKDYVIIGCEGNSNLKTEAVTQDIILHNITEKQLDINVDMTTSFEVAEHVDEKDQDKFWRNIKRLGKFHFCSIHVCGDKTDNHKFIRSTDWWISYFIDNLQVKDVYVLQRPGAYPTGMDFHNFTQIPWECSAILLIEW